MNIFGWLVHFKKKKKKNYNACGVCETQELEYDFKIVRRIYTHITL